ncbi:MAG: phospholipase D-like domain-containing protein [Nitrospiraceae bacterium]
MWARRCGAARRPSHPPRRARFVHPILWLLLAIAGIWPYQGWPNLETYYAPEDEPGDRLVRLYRDAEHYIYVAMYAFTYPPAVRALAAAKKRGVDVRVITDRGRLQDQKQMAALEALRLAGVPIRINRHDNLMHLKEVIVDDRVNTNGSMNQTSSGNGYNDERLDIIMDATSTAKAKHKFLTMWRDRERYADWTGGPLGIEP